MRRAIAPAAYALLGLAVAAPLLGRGLVLAVDLALTPRAPLDASYWGLGQGTHEGPPSRLPLDALFALLGRVGLVAAGEQLLLVAIIALAGWGMHRAVPVRHPAARVFAGVLYAANPFVYDRLITGQWFLLLGYTLLPHALAALLAVVEGRRGAPWRSGALLFATGVASPHMGLLLLALSAAVLAASARRPRALARGAGALALGLAPSLFWLVPTPGVRDLWRHVGPAQLELYRTAADKHLGVAGAVAGLSGYWNDAAPALARLPAWPALVATLLFLAAWGAVLGRRSPVTWAIAASGVLAFAFAIGDASALTRGPFVALLDHVAPLRSFREPQKAVALVALAYAWLGSLAVDELVAGASREPVRRRAVTAVAVALPAVLAVPLLWGLGGELRPSAFPASWSAADAALSREGASDRTLVLPWHGYFALRFAGGRVVANPAPGFFRTPVLASRSVAPDGAVADNADPVERQVSALLATGARRSDVASCLAGLGVGHVLLAREADWRSAAFLLHRRDLVVERRWGNLVLLRNTVPASVVMAAPRDAGPCSPRIRPLAVTRRSRVRIELASAPPAGTRLRLALPDPAGWRLQGRELVYAPWAAYRRAYALGAAGIALFALSGLAAALLAARRRRPERRPVPVAAAAAPAAATA